MPAFSPIRFYHELRRRRMIKVTLIYLAGAWAVIGACDLLLPQAVVDVEAAMRIVFALAIVVLPIALVFGWRYDITDKGVRRTAKASGDSATSGTALHRRDHLLIGTLSTAVVAILATGAFSISQLPRVIPAPPENSIAVLPFEICTDQDLDIRLAPALAMEVINHLAERAQLMVIARKSSFTMAGFGLSLPEIAEPLGVRYLLKGELCRDGDTPTLAVELFDEGGANVWAHRYQQQTDASDRITQTLPSLVADGVAMQLGGVSAVKPVEPVDSEAYEQLLIGREHRWQGDRDKAREAFERALEIQPDYAEAVFQMALLQRAGSHLKQGSNIAGAWPYGQKALVLIKDELERGVASAHVYSVAGYINFWMARWENELFWRESGEMNDEEIEASKESVRSGYAEAERYFRTSLALNPTNTDTYYWLSTAIEDQDIQRRAEGLEVLEQGLARDPFNDDFNWSIAKRWASRGRYREAMELLERVKALPEIPTGAWWGRLEIMKMQGYLDERCETLIDMLLNHPEAFESGGNRAQALWFLEDLALLGLYEEAEAWHARISGMRMEGWSGVLRRWFLTHYRMATGHLDEVVAESRAKLDNMSNQEVLDADDEEVIGLAWHVAFAGDMERAIQLLESLQHARTVWHERQMNAAASLAALYQEVGRYNEAAPILDKVVAFLEREYESGIRHPQTLNNLAEAYARQGRDEAALDMLRKAIDYHSRDDALYVDFDMYRKFSPWERLRDDPRFIVLWNRMEADLEQQAIRIRAMLAEHDVDELLAPLMAFVEEPATETIE